ncbi:MAG: M48 family metalloprotease [Rickettsiales bacterium]|nr:M48 family metalloprotease [Rickettsiales bacterium]
MFSSQFKKNSVLIIALFLLCILLSRTVFALPSIRDTEIENFIKDISEPILEAADINPLSVKFYIINDKNINAFVFGGSNIFLHTGLLQVSETPDMLIGVIAHEIGHIYEGHILSINQEYRQQLLSTTLGYVLGIAAVAAGSPEAAQAIISGSTQISQRNLLSHSRTQEQEADKIAITLLKRAQFPIQGLVDLFAYLSRLEVTQKGEVNPYIQTHPLSRERISFIKNSVENSIDEDFTVPEPFKERYLKIYVKLNAFLKNPEITLEQYPTTDSSEIARYARAIAYHKKPNIQNSIDEISSLIQDFPDNPYYHELKGQILFENGRGKEALSYYQTANELLPFSPLILIQLAKSHLEYDDEAQIRKAITYLNQSLSIENDNIQIFRQLAVAHGKIGNVAQSNLYLAEENLRRGKKNEAQKFLKRALEHLEPDSPSYIRARDIEHILDKNETSKK